MSQDAHFTSDFDSVEQHRRTLGGAWRERLLSLALAVAIGMGLAYSYNARRVIPDQIALGSAVQIKPGIWNGVRVNAHRLPDYPALYPPKGPDGAPVAGPLWIWLGNSQMHAINQLRPDDQVAAAHASRIAGFPVFGLSIPNSCPRENLLVTAWALSRSSPQWVIVPVVFDMLRFYDPRREFGPLLDDRMRAELSATPLEQSLVRDVERNGAEENRDAQGTSRLGFSLQTITEDYLNRQLSDHWQLWRDRDQAYATLFNDAYRLRNRALGIRTSTKRPSIPARVEGNMAALADLCDLARRHGSKVLVYIAPIRWDVEPPYELDEYNAWKSRVRALCREHGAEFADFDRLIPDDLWGIVGDDIDFMHFQGEAHRLLAERVVSHISHLNDSSSAPSAASTDH